MNQPRVFEERLAKMLQEYSGHAARRPSSEVLSRTVNDGVAVLRRPRWQTRFAGRPRLFVFAALLLSLSVGAAIVGGGLLDRRTAVLPPVGPTQYPGIVVSPDPNTTPMPTPPPDANHTPAPRGTAQPAVFTPSCKGMFKNSGPERLPAPSNHVGQPTAGSLVVLLWVPGDETSLKYLALVDPQSGQPSPELFFGQLAYLRVLPTDGQNLLDWSPDGRYFTLHYSGATDRHGQYAPCDDAFLVSADGADAWHMLGADSDEEFVAWGIDGATWITSSRADGGASAYIRSLASGDRIDLGAPCAGCRLGAFAATWATDGASFAGTALDPNGQSRPVFHDGQGWVGAELTGWGLGWIGDQSVLVAATDPDGGSRLVSWTPRSPGFTEVAPLPVDPATALLLLSPDGSLLALSDRRTAIEVVDLASGQRTPVADIRRNGGPQSVQLAWSPDSRRLAFTSGSTLSSVNPDGSDLRLLAGAVTAGLSWQPVWP
jgi:hypothetical protein